MGIIRQGILGGVSGRVGSVVGASWKGIPTIRVYQPNVSNPQTALQTAQRDAFKTIGLIGSQLLNPLIKAFWDRFAVKESGYNAFIKANKVEGGGFLDLFSTVIFSKGKLTANKALDSDGISKFVTGDASGFSASRFDLSSDEIYGIFYHTKEKEYWSVRANAGLTTAPAVRNSVSYNVPYASFPASWDMEDSTLLRGAFVARRADGSQVSECIGLAPLTDV